MAGSNIHVNPNDIEKNTSQGADINNFNHAQRGQWLRAATLGANDGLVTVASLMMGVDAVKQDIKAMLLAGFAGLIAGACSMAIGEFVSVYTQVDIEVAHQMKRNGGSTSDGVDKDDDAEELPNPFQAALASALAFIIGAIVPLLAAAFVKDHKVRVAVVLVVSSTTLAVFGAVGAVLGRTSVGRSCLRVVVGGLLAIAITFGLTKLIGSTTGLGM